MMSSNIMTIIMYITVHFIQLKYKYFALLSISDGAVIRTNGTAS